MQRYITLGLTQTIVAHKMELKDALSLAVALLALGISLLSLLLKGPENRRTIRSQLTDALTKLNTVNAEARKFSIEKEAERHTPTVNAMFSFFNDQRRFLARQAVFLAEQIPEHVTDVEYGLIARAFDNMGDQTLADLYWQKCVSVSQGDYARGLNLRGYAAYQFGQGSYVEARRSYAASIGANAGDSDRARHTVGETYMRWAVNEVENGFKTESESLFERSKVEFEGVRVPRLRAHGLQSLAETRPVPKLSTPQVPAGGGRET